MNYVLPLQDALADILALEVDNIEAVKLRQGSNHFTSHKGGNADLIASVTMKNRWALAKSMKGVLAPLRVFNMNITK